MKKYPHKFAMMIISLFFVTSVFAGEKFYWEPVTEADWSVVADSAKGYRDAVMLFEKVTADDRKFADGKTYLTIYRRIRILDAEGRDWGDVLAPLFYKKQKIEEVKGRTILPDGREIALAKDQIFEKQAIKTKGAKIKQTNFSLPGITDDCIIEYYLKYKLPRPFGMWIIQKEIPVLHAELRWNTHTLPGDGLLQILQAPKSIRSEAFEFMNKHLTPNYLWLPADFRLSAKFNSGPNASPGYTFIAKDVAAFREEPYALPDIAMKPQLRYYYGGAATPENYWAETAETTRDAFEKFTKKKKRIRNAVASMASLATDDEKIAVAYKWIQNNIKNAAYLNGEKFKKNKSADKAIDKGVGTRDDMNRVFCALLREMNIDAKMAYAVDRDDILFVPEAKYWQFNRSLVAIQGDRGKYRFYSPGEQFLQMGRVPWYIEGVEAFVASDSGRVFAAIPFSPAKYNRTIRSIHLRLQDDGSLQGRIVERRTGHSARNLRISLAGADESEQQELVKEDLSRFFPDAEIDSATVNTLAANQKALIVKCTAKLPSSGVALGSRLLLKPFAFLNQDANPFQAEKRNHLIMFDYAYEVLESTTLTLPESWQVEALPADTTYANQAGRCDASFLQIGNSISIQRSFKLYHPVFSVKSYPIVRELFQTRQALNGLTVVLNKSAVLETRNDR